MLGQWLSVPFVQIVLCLLVGSAQHYWTILHEQIQEWCRHNAMENQNATNNIQKNIKHNTIKINEYIKFSYMICIKKNFQIYKF